MAHFLIDGYATKIEISKKKQFTFSREWFSLILKDKAKSVLEVHAHVKYDEDLQKYYLENYGNTIINGVTVEIDETVYLENHSALIIGEILLVFYDQEQQIKRDDAMFVKSVALDYEKVKSASERFSKELFRDAPKKLNPFVKYTLEFIHKKFKCNRSVFYAVKDNKLKPMCAIAPKSFSPSKKILDELWKTKKPVMFNLTNDLDTQYDISNSIVKDNICSAIAIPLSLDNDLVGVIYVDVISNSLNYGTKELSVLCSLIPGITALYLTMVQGEKERLKADLLFKCFCTPTTSDRFLVNYLPGNGYGLSRQIVDGDIFVMIHVKADEEVMEDYTLLIATYALIISAISSVIGKATIEKYSIVYEAINNVVFDKIRYFNISIAIATCGSQLLRFTCFGDLYLLTKYRNNISFYTKTKDGYFEVSGNTIPQEQQVLLKKDMRLFITHEKNDCAENFDKTVSFSGASQDLQKNKIGGILFEMKKEGDNYEEIQL